MAALFFGIHRGNVDRQPWLRYMRLNSRYSCPQHPFPRIPVNDYRNEQRWIEPAVLPAETTEEKLREAFKSANAIVALEGWIPSPDDLAIQERVIRGELTYDQGVRQQIKPTATSALM